MRMSWLDLCFLHWRVDAEAFDGLIPRGITLDTFDGSAWIGVVPFHMSDVGVRGVRSPRGITAFGELNVRTYVTVGGKPGVWFLSLDATDPSAVRIARAVFHLPYYNARIDRSERDGVFSYHSTRTDPRGGAADLDVTYRPTGQVTRSLPGSLEYFLVERYCLYAVSGRGRILRTEVDHDPWELQPAQADVARCTMTQPPGIVLPPEPPIAHFSRRLDVIAWRPRRA